MTAVAKPRLLSIVGGLTFVDLDGALRHRWPLLDVWEFWGAHGSPAAGRAAGVAIAELARGTDVEAVVRATCTVLATVCPTALEEIGTRWWDECGRHARRHPVLVEAIADAHAAGDQVVLVSHAPAQVVAALARAVDPTATLLCSTAEIGPAATLTGFLEVAMTGATRRAAVAAIARAAGHDLAVCRAHGFGWADAELLALIGTGIAAPQAPLDRYDPTAA